MSGRMLYDYLLKALCMAALIICAAMQFRFALQQQNIFLGKTGDDSALSSHDAGLLTFTAKQKFLFDADIQSGLSMVQRALTLNPYYVPAWLLLAELNNDLGRKKQATKILVYVDSLTRDIKWWRWDKALTAYQLGRLDVLPDELRYIVREIPGKSRNDALQLAFTLWEEPAELLGNMGEENLLHLFISAVQRKMVPEALFLWQKINETASECPEKNFLHFVNMLIGTGDLGVAGEIWHRHYPESGLLFNGNFAAPLLGSGFGWRAGRDKGFELRLEEDPEIPDGKSLRLRFKGWDNLNFHHLYQIVPLQGNKAYTLIAHWKSDRLTTDQRPFFEVYGYKCKMDYAKSEMISPDQDWQPEHLEFTVPEECSAVVLRLRRRESIQIDNKLSGKLWLRNLDIEGPFEIPPSPEDLEL
jgi:tetratricopeptide (TPR) repeat protein